MNFQQLSGEEDWLIRPWLCLVGDNDSVTNRGLNVFWGSASGIQLPRAPGCLRIVLSEPQIIAQNHWENVRSFLGHSSKNGHSFYWLCAGLWFFFFFLSIHRRVECQSEIAPLRKAFGSWNPDWPHRDTWEPPPLLPLVTVSVWKALKKKHK